MMRLTLLLVTFFALVAVGTTAPSNRRQPTTTPAPKTRQTNPKHGAVVRGSSPKQPDNKVNQINPKDDNKKPTEKTVVASGVFIIDAPVICAEGQRADRNGNCKENWGRKRRAADGNELEDLKVVPICIIGCEIPPRDCPDGQKPDLNGDCRDDWDG